MKRKLLALGGPKNLQWISEPPGMEMFIVPVFGKAVFQETELSGPVSASALGDTVVYRLQQLNDVLTQDKKDVWVADGTSFPQALAILKDYLLQQFVMMEDVIEYD